jgi:hypothetical protein
MQHASAALMVSHRSRRRSGWPGRLPDPTGAGTTWPAQAVQFLTRPPDHVLVVVCRADHSLEKGDRWASGRIPSTAGRQAASPEFERDVFKRQFGPDYPAGVFRPSATAFPLPAESPSKAEYGRCQLRCSRDCVARPPSGAGSIGSPHNSRFSADGSRRTWYSPPLDPPPRPSFHAFVGPRSRIRLSGAWPTAPWGNEEKKAGLVVLAADNQPHRHPVLIDWEGRVSRRSLSHCLLISA